MTLPCLKFGFNSSLYGFPSHSPIPYTALALGLGNFQILYPIVIDISIAIETVKGWWNILHYKLLITSNVWNMGQFSWTILNISGSINVSVERHRYHMGITKYFRERFIYNKCVNRNCSCFNKISVLLNSI